MARQYIRRPTLEDRLQARREYTRTYKKGHPKVVSEIRHNYYLRNKDKIRVYQAAYRELHRDEINAKRRARYRAEFLATFQNTES